ncbi:Glutamate-tRNA ligase [Zancudomyces culisetae]|uniref:Glutamate--tRNA ligase, mitochondrial n=1 Tax=Zancudomyces culisetae TaxID=1213189 RepID=A0A1R1PL30_ZANCU|nr:Glutamate-tRNA ligase [Zancudomyces culisetae]|eukprot:OMH81582.1 Glutamate-tRNA ligase [Zancudomyces culisetae]
MILIHSGSSNSLKRPMTALRFIQLNKQFGNLSQTHNHIKIQTSRGIRIKQHPRKQRWWYSTNKKDETASSGRDIRVRFAPSPTGKLHLGGLRTALLNYLFAKKAGGKIVLRIEDTDRKRTIPGAADAILKTLKWAGIEFDESFEKGGKYGPYIQSERNELYQKYADEMIKNDKAYRCFCTTETLEEIRNKAIHEGRIPVYDRRCSKLDAQSIQKRIDAGDKFVVRLKCPKDINLVNDVVYGTIKMGLAQLDDAVLLKSDGTPTYHLAHPVDDHYMKITHVFRGEEWLPSTPKHLAVFRALGWEPPQYVHLPLLLNTDGTKLSKRNMDTEVEGYINKGYMAEALVNFVAFLGWTPKLRQNQKQIPDSDLNAKLEGKTKANSVNSEVMNLSQLVKVFSIDDLNKSNAIVNIEKLNWFNKQHVYGIIQDHKRLDDLINSSYGKELAQRIKDDLDLDCVPDPELLKKSLSLCKERLSFFEELVTVGRYFFRDSETNIREYVNAELSNLKDEKMPAKIIISTLNYILTSSVNGASASAPTAGKKVHELSENLESVYTDLLDTYSFGVQKNVNLSQKDNFQLSSWADFSKPVAKQLGVSLKTVYLEVVNGPSLKEIMEIMGYERVVGLLYTGLKTLQ